MSELAMAYVSEVKRLQVENARLRDALEQIVNCEEGAWNMWETARQALEDKG